MEAYTPTLAVAESVRNLWADLQEAEKSPDSALLGLMLACKTQSTLAKYGNKTSKIKPLSLNTLKLACESVVEIGGWDAVDKLRKKLYVEGLLRAGDKPKARRGIQRELELSKEREKGADSRLQKILRERAVMVVAYSHLLSILRQNEHQAPALREALAMHEATFDVRRLFNTRQGESSE